MSLANGVIPIDPEVDVEAMVAKEHAAQPPALELEAGETGRIGQPRPPAIGQLAYEPACAIATFQQELGDLRVEALLQGNDVVEKALDPLDDPTSPHRIVDGPPFGSVLLTDDIGPVEGVVEATPACVGRIESVPGVVHRHDELWPRDRRNLRIHILRGDREGVVLRDQVADLGEEGLVCVRVERCARPFPGLFLMPCIDLLFVTGPHLEETAVLGAESLDDGPERSPDRVGVEIRARCDL